jgi:hypothetical protein
MEGSSYINYAIYAIIIVLIISIVNYIYKQLNKKRTNNNDMEYSLDGVKVEITSLNINNPKFKHKLRDYYIASSYNSCCGGDFKNDYVDYVPLKQVIKQGARMLDFEIYSLNSRPVVAASSESSYNLKETYNSLPFDDVMEIISRYAFSSSTCPNPNDPLFIHLRVKSNHEDIYKSMAKSIKSQFSKRLLGEKYKNEAHGENLGTVPLKEFVGKVVIICDSTNDNFRKVPIFEELVNMTSSSQFMRGLRNYDVTYTHDADELVEYNKKQMTVVIPDLTNESNNMPASLHHKYGCQFVCMSYQTFDENLKYYLTLFNENGHAFILKPKKLRYIPVTIPAPTPQNPQLSYAPRTIQKPYYKHQI